MPSFLAKLARLPPLPGAAPPPAPPPEAHTPERIVEPDPALRAPRPAPLPTALPSSPPTLDDLRDRIARIIARTPAPAPRADPARGELPFALELTEHGPLYVHRSRSLPAARVGRVPLV